MKIVDQKPRLSYDDVLIKPLRSRISSRSEVSLESEFCGNKFSIPIISSNMDTITEANMAKKMSALGGLGLIHRYMSVEKQIGFLSGWENNLGPIAVSVGTLKNDKLRIDTTIDYIINMSSLRTKNAIICVDIAHGHSEHMIDTIKYIRRNGFSGGLMAGAVCTPEGTRDLLDAGADIVRVGIGGGSVCTTRVKTGCGYPQLSAVMECASVGPIIADGGIRTPGDAAKAMAAGAKAVMLGGMLAGTDCVPGWMPHASYMRFRGMASAEAREAFGQAGVNAEGVSCDVPTKPPGSTETVITEVAEGIRSAMSYSNSVNLKEFNDKAEFVLVTSSTIAENNPHILNRKSRE